MAVIACDETVVDSEFRLCPGLYLEGAWLAFLAGQAGWFACWLTSEVRAVRAVRGRLKHRAGSTPCRRMFGATPLRKEINRRSPDRVRGSTFLFHSVLWLKHPRSVSRVTLLFVVFFLYCYAKPLSFNSNISQGQRCAQSTAERSSSQKASPT